ncbi:MAG: TrkH family potassium uptake protein [Paracoccaceae bacterium]
MSDLRPILSVIGYLTLVLGASMLVPGLIDLSDGSENWRGFALSAFLTLSAGGIFVTLTSRESVQAMTRRQAFLLTTLVWLTLPCFGAVPFVYGAPQTTVADAFFEAMSGLTTTGATVFSDLEAAPRGLLFWRALLQWYGGVGIVVVAVLFLPALKIGGMQFFRSEGFDARTDIMPQARALAQNLMLVYAGLTVFAILGYSAAGMTIFDALCHAMTTVSTGGYANYDASFGAFDPAAQYVAVVFMALGAMPFVVLVQAARGRTLLLWNDAQIRAFMAIIAGVAVLLATWLALEDDRPIEPAFRHALFNVTSILTGTGYASEDFGLWGGFPSAVFFILALIGGCAGSTSCSAKIFRYQILFAALAQQIRRIHSPSGVFPLRYQHRVVEAEVLSSVMAYFFVFVTAVSVWAMLLSMFGLSAITCISGSVAALANVGPGLGAEIGPGGTYAGLNDGAKWLLSAGMLLGRLEFVAVLVLLTPDFWRR